MASVKDPEEAWSIPDVYLLTKGVARRVAIPDLELTFGARDLALARSSGKVIWRCTWSKVDELSIAERSILPDGREGVVVAVVERGGRHHRFVLPTDDPVAVEANVRALAAAHRIRTLAPQAAVVRRLTVAVMVATTATLILLLLSAAHVLHF
ncbi:MAG TPA: hypothetical protein VND70_03495 [Acidimicrobiales bacterium]|nr:hypothetical protein [Acidimicrobiales bacterium]